MTITIPNVFENNRTIPAGKVLTADCPPAGDPRARIEVLGKGMGRIGFVELEACHAGWAIAGSTCRWDNGAFAVSFEFQGSTHRRRFKTYEEARTLFDRWTME
jgi:hypothetical protein